MKAVWDSCKEAGLEIPDEVDDFFGYQPPSKNGNIIPDDELNECVRYFDLEREDLLYPCAEIEIDKIPKHIQFLRVLIVG